MTGVMVLRRVHTFPSFPPLAGSQSAEAATLCRSHPALDPLCSFRDEPQPLLGLQ